MRTFRFLILFCLLTASVLAMAQGEAKSEPQKSDTQKSEPAQKTADQVFKNIQSLKGTPADQLVPSMQYFSAALGVQCGFCHVTAPAFAPEKDDKDEKKTARTMIAMVQSINQANFKGRPEVGCATCHGGRSNPAILPPLGDERPQSARQANRAEAPPLPSADQVLQNYFTAVGGKAALEKITSKVTKGSLTTPQGKLQFEIDQKAPSMFLASIVLPSGGSIQQGFNGSMAWRKGDRGPAGEMAGPELALARVGARFFDPELTPAEKSVSPRVVSETWNGHDCYVLRETAPDGIFERLYFDKQTGLLVRRMIIERTLFGLLPSNWNLSDYRDVNGVKIPFTTVDDRWDGEFIFNADSIQLNVPLEDGKFQKPAQPPTPGGAR
jgi:photosynthetic reaction center cytochrome c subunit